MSDKKLGALVPGDRVIRSTTRDVHTVESVEATVFPGVGKMFSTATVVCDRGMTLSGTYDTPVELAE